MTTIVMYSMLGHRLANMSAVLAQTLTDGGGSTEWAAGFTSIIGLLNMVGMVLCFGGLLFSAAMFMMGQTERVLYGVVGAAIGGLAWVITKTMFETGGGAQDISID